MIGPNSRYRTATVQAVVGPKTQPRQEMRVAFPTAKRISYTYYRVEFGERIDNIAADFYGDAEQWWLIADANPEILDWFDLTPGDIIRIPSG